jgi:hypothetical protein
MRYKIKGKTHKKNSAKKHHCACCKDKEECVFYDSDAYEVCEGFVPLGDRSKL